MCFWLLGVCVRLCIQVQEQPRMAPADSSIVNSEGSLPVISLRGDRSRIVDEIKAACEKWGLFQIIDHGVDPGLIAQMLQISRAFLAIPPEFRYRFHARGGGPDLLHNTIREFYIFDTMPAQKRDYSKWPDQPPEWRNVLQKYCETMHAVALDLLRLVSLALGLEENDIVKACKEPTQRIVLNYYRQGDSSGSSPTDTNVALVAHCDPCAITILVQDDVSGLETSCDGGKTWVSAPPLPGALVVNLGTYLEVISNGKFEAAYHRAVVNTEKSRISLAMFLYPAEDVLVEPLPGVLKQLQGQQCLQETPVTFKEHYVERFTRYATANALQHNQKS